MGRFQIYVNGEKFILPGHENALNDTDLSLALGYASDRARFEGVQVVECYLGESLIGSFDIRANECESYFGKEWNADAYYKNLCAERDFKDDMLDFLKQVAHSNGENSEWASRLIVRYFNK